MLAEPRPATDTDPAIAAAQAQLPVTCLPPWTVAELPEPMPIHWRHWSLLIGPAIVMIGNQIGGGEWLIGPEVTAKYGGGLMWLATVSIVLQVFYNLEAGRYALYCGEPVFTGFLRTRPGPRFWVTFFLLLSVGGVLPGLVFNAASCFGAVWLNRPPVETDRIFIVQIAYGCLGLIILPVLFGGKIYNTIQAIMSIKVIFVLGTTFVLGVCLVSPESWLNVFSGFLKFGTVPTKDASGNPVAVNALVEFFSGNPLPTLDLKGIDVIAGFAAVAGGGGLSNCLYSNFVRDKGWGMGSQVGAIPSAVGGKEITLSHLGKVFIPTADNLRKWRIWWRYILVEQGLIWMPGCFVGMALPALLSMQFARYSPLTSQPKPFDWAQPVVSADGLRHFLGMDSPLALALWYLMLLVGVMILLPSQMATVDEVCRRWTDTIWSSNPRVRDKMSPHQAKYVYYSLLAGFVVWSCCTLYLFGRFGTPKLMFLVVANVGNVALGTTAFLILWVNTRFLPPEIRPRWYNRLGLVGCGVFYLGLAAMVWQVKQWPLIKEWLGM